MHSRPTAAGARTVIRKTRPFLLAAAATLAMPAAAADQAGSTPKAAAPAIASPLPSVRPRQTSTLTVRSQEGLDYTIFVSAPVGAPPKGGFPVLYVLDANAWFGVAAEITRLYELEGGPAIVVGVGYPVGSLYAPHRRGHDFTLGPPATGELSVYEGTDFGGADAFLTFLRSGLRNTIAAKYPIDRTRQSLFGHSLGGFFVLHVLLTQPDAFAAYVAASPAAWWDLAKLAAAEVRASARTRPAHPPAVLLASGGAEQKLGAADTNLLRRMHAANPAMFNGKPIEQVLQETRAQMGRSKMVDNARDFAARLTKLGIPTDFVVFDEENHRSVVPPALGRGMPLLFQIDR